MKNQKLFMALGFVVVLSLVLSLAIHRSNQVPAPSHLQLGMSETERFVNRGTQASLESANRVAALKSDSSAVAPTSYDIGTPTTSEVFPKMISIRVSDSLSINRQYHKLGLYSLPALTEDSVETYISDMKKLALDGNGSAAFSVYNLLNECSTRARTAADFRVREQEILTTQIDGSGLSMEDMLSANRMTYLLCNSVTDKNLETADKWFHMALEQGSHFARQQHARSFLATDIVEAGRQYKQLWDDGYTNSGYSLAHVYRSSDFDGTNPSQPNLVKALAFQIAQDMVNMAGLETSDGPYVPLMIAEIETAQSIAKAELTLQQQEEAQLLAETLVKKNENCCVWVWSQ